VVAAPGERSLHARQRAERIGGATENRQKPPKTAFDFGRSEAGSFDCRAPTPIGSEAIFDYGRKSLADTL
jgi:hypothetical protein